MPSPTTSPEILTSEQAAALLQLCPDTIRRMVRRGELVAARVGGRIRLTRASIDAWLAAQTQTQT